MAINSITPTGELSSAHIEKIKSTETTRIMASFDRLLKLQSQILGELKTSGDTIVLPEKEFVEIFNETILHAKTDDQKTIISELLEKLVSLSKKTQ